MLRLAVLVIVGCAGVLAIGAVVDAGQISGVLYDTDGKTRLSAKDNQVNIEVFYMMGGSKIILGKGHHDLDGSFLATWDSTVVPPGQRLTISFARDKGATKPTASFDAVPKDAILG